jgi:succinate-semialdehyde dehydrogenase/glutarate-semialdehyde dehydrogenase
MPPTTHKEQLMRIESINPATEEVVESFESLDEQEIATALENAERCGRRWPGFPMKDRGMLLERVALLLRARKEHFGELMAREMGKPIREGIAEAEKCAWVCEYYAANAERFLSPEPVDAGSGRAYVRFDPLGPVLAVMPWNFPFWQVFRFAAPALMAGNVGLLKHSSNVPRCSLAIEGLFDEAGVPHGVFQSLLVPARAVPALIESPVVRAVTLTGSEGAGATVAAAAGRALKKTVLELGGSDPFLVLDDADVPAVAAWAAKARCINSGQSCIAAKRFIVAETIADRFVAAFRAEMEKLVVGDPLDPATQVGPLARLDLLESVHGQVERSVAAGARLVTGGKRLPRRGYFYPPTLLDGVTPGMAAADEETFGPVAAVLRVSSDEEAVALANASRYGLGASVWSGEAARAEALAASIESGCVFVNDMVKSDPRLPFGGVKLSGYGRELSAYGIREFVNVKTVWAQETPPGAAAPPRGGSRTG